MATRRTWPRSARSRSRFVHRPTLTAAIDREVERLAAEQPSQKITRSDVVRNIPYRTLFPVPPPEAAKEAKETTARKPKPAK